jgi:hypothetical protein
LVYQKIIYNRNYMAWRDVRSFPYCILGFTIFIDFYEHILQLIFYNYGREGFYQNSFFDIPFKVLLEVF